MSNAKYYYLCALIFLLAANTASSTISELIMTIGCFGSMVLSIYFSIKGSKQ